MRREARAANTERAAIISSAADRSAEPPNPEPAVPPGSALTARARQALAAVLDPELRRPITDLDMVAAVTATDAGAVTVTIRLTIVGCPAADAIQRDVAAAVAAVPGVSTVAVVLTVMTPQQRQQLTERLRGSSERAITFGPGSLTRVYAVTSGKGGVGKSTLTGNLAVALASRGLSVGVVDADVHGFSIPAILGISAATRPTRLDALILPPVTHGVKVISIGMFLPEGSPTAVAWRGPMLHRTLRQFLTEVHFGDLDVLLLDLPPGTGDVAISVGQLLPNAEVLVVTTPQVAAAEVAERSGLVARQAGQHVYGVIENMAGLPQPDGSVLQLFGSGGGSATAARLSTGQPVPVPLLGSIPLSVPLRAGGDQGRPIVLTDPEDPAARAILAIADELAARGRNLPGRRLPLGLR